MITTGQKLQLSDHHLYVLSDAGLLLGMLKLGRKKLFLVDPSDTMREYQPLCVLDFYVHESCQRQGFGRELFFFALEVREE